MHRDIKPDNFLMHGDKVKMCDFGTVKDTRNGPPFSEYVSTRWYRSPETVLRSTEYGPASDIFAVGCIMGELFNLYPVFPGESEAD